VTTPLLDGKSVIITGAARGLGASYARHLAQLGARLVVADIDEDPLKLVADEIAAAGGTVEAVRCDVADCDQVDDLVAHAVRSYGVLDGIVNNAGLQIVGSVPDGDPAAIRRLVEVNVLGVMWGTRAAAAVMKPQGHGSIVNVTSGSQSGMEYLSYYGGSKGAVASFIYGAAIDLRGSGVRVNGISPLGSGTRMSEEMTEFRRVHGLPGRTQPIPNPTNNAPAVAFLLSDRSVDVTGQVVRVDPDGVSLVAHPIRIGESLVRGDGWTLESVAAAYDDHLGSFAVPLRGPV
jgi:NAD(P)-dependent dehydrogenase (short-subunit alcohol dehydrogenase family)